MQKEPGRYTISITNGYTTNSTTGAIEPIYGEINKRNITMTLKLPRQTIRLRTIKVIVKSNDDALRMRDIWISLPFLSFNHLVDNTSTLESFSFPLSGALTYENALEKPLYMSKDAESQYQITIKDGDGNIATNIYCIYLDFETEKGSLNV